MEESSWQSRTIRRAVDSGDCILLDHGVSVNSGNGEALFCAVQEGLLKTVEFLLQAGAIPQSCNCSYTLMPGKPPHYFTLLEKVRSWRWRWNEAMENDLFQMISEATGRWAKHPQITELAYQPSKGEKMFAALEIES